MAAFISTEQIDRFMEEAGPITLTNCSNIEVSVEFLRSLVKKILELEQYIDDRFQDHNDRYTHEYSRNY